jgi:hypothetical protein
MGDHPSGADLRMQGRPVEWRSKAGAARDWSHAQRSEHGEALPFDRKEQGGSLYEKLAFKSWNRGWGSGTTLVAADQLNRS